MVIWFDKWRSKPNLDLWLKIRNLQLYGGIGLEYVKEVFGIGYKIKNYNNKTKCKTEYESYDKIMRGGQIVDMEDYNIQ